MLPFLRRTALAAALLLSVAPSAWCAATGEGVNTAGVIDFPTALDQITRHTFHGTLAIYDLGEPDLRARNARYGLQLGNLQLLADTYWRTDTKEFDHLEGKAKLRILNLDEYHTYAALGFLARYVDKEEKEKTILDDKVYSLFAIVTTELFPFANWDGLLVNFYLDNRFGSLGLKVPLYQFIRAVGEVSVHHAGKEDERTHGKVGVELEGEQSFYIQFLYADQAAIGPGAKKEEKDKGLVSVQIGTGF